MFALLLACTWALGGRHAGAEARSRTHHPVGRALSSTSFVPASSHGTRVPKTRKASLRGESGAGGSRHGDATHSSPAHGHAPHGHTAVKAQGGRRRSAEFSDDFVPLSRAELRRARRSGRSPREVAERSMGAPGARQRRYAESFAATRSSASSRQGRSGSRPRSLVGNDRIDLAYERRSTNTNGSATYSPSQTAQPFRNDAYAQGLSQPGDDERRPRSPGSLNDALIGTAEVQSAPSTRSQAFASPNSVRSNSMQPQLQLQVVQGFGGEVAVMATDPGTTRRRNHPIAAAALPGMPPPTLEERYAITEAAVSPAVLPEIYNRDGRLLMPAPLKGSREVLVHQNTMANNDGLERIQDDNELDRLRANRELVSFPTGDDLRVNEALPYNRRYARPWTVLFAGDIGHDFFNRFHQPLVVTSAVRTVNYQMRLQRVNGNAAATDGDAASPHLTGQAIDLAKRGMSSAELAWMRAYLLPLMNAGKIDVEEEFQQACFHISVYRRYAVGRRTMQFAQVQSVTRIDDGSSANLPQDAP